LETINLLLEVWERAPFRKFAHNTGH
jgi:hypothetical protein